jgi:hypothetical protein
MVETAKAANGLHGPKLYQERARRALPILVQQAHARQPIAYNGIARELGMSNPRNMNYVLGCVGTALSELSDEWGEQIPLLQALVVTKNTGLPGVGIEGFFENKAYAKLNKQDRARLVSSMLQKVYYYRDWSRVLRELKLKPLKHLDGAVEASINSSIGRGGEGPLHKALKAYILANPSVLGLQKVVHKEDERYLASGDSIDVYFETSQMVLGVEVKSRISSEEDIIRGLFQCIKYKAVLEAEAKFRATAKSVDTILVIETSLTPKLISMANRLGVEVIENCRS